MHCVTVIFQRRSTCFFFFMETTHRELIHWKLNGRQTIGRGSHLPCRCYVREFDCALCSSRIELFSLYCSTNSLIKIHWKLFSVFFIIIDMTVSNCWELTAFLYLGIIFMKIWSKVFTLFSWFQLQKDEQEYHANCTRWSTANFRIRTCNIIKTAVIGH